MVTSPNSFPVILLQENWWNDSEFLSWCGPDKMDRVEVKFHLCGKTEKLWKIPSEEPVESEPVREALEDWEEQGTNS